MVYTGYYCKITSMCEINGFMYYCRYCVQTNVANNTRYNE